MAHVVRGFLLNLAFVFLNLFARRLQKALVYDFLQKKWIKGRFFQNGQFTLGKIGRGLHSNLGPLYPQIFGLKF